MLSLEKASQRYALSLEELRAWERDLDRYGLYGLRATRLQIYRDTDEARAAKVPPLPAPPAVRGLPNPG